MFNPKSLFLAMNSPSKNTCVTQCASSSINFFGFCLACPDSSCSSFTTTSFTITRLNDLDYKLTSSNGLLTFTQNILKYINVTIEGLTEGVDFKYVSTIQDENDFDLRISFEFLTSFENKLMTLTFGNNSSNTTNNRLLQTNDQESTRIVDVNLNEVSSLSASLLIPLIDITNFKPNSEGSLRTIEDIPWLTSLVSYLVFLFYVTLILCLISILLSNQNHFKDWRVRSLKFWYFSLFRHIIIISVLGLINRMLSSPFEIFLIQLYSKFLGLDDFPVNAKVNSNYTLNEPQFYRLHKTDSLTNNCPVLICIHLVLGVLVTMFALLRWVRKSSTLSKRFFSYLSGNVLFVLIFPFSLELIVNAMLNIRNAQFRDAEGLIDFVMSLLYFLSFFFGNLFLTIC